MAVWLSVFVWCRLWTDFAGWGLQQLFCGVLLVLTILFLALTAAARVPMSRRQPDTGLMVCRRIFRFEQMTCLGSTILHKAAAAV